MKNMKLRLTCFVLIVCSFTSETTADTLRTVALSGDVAAGTDSNFSGFDKVVLNDLGQTAFQAIASKSEANKVGIWSEGGGSLHSVALGGNAAPGTDSFFDDFSVLTVPNISNSGHTVFSTELVGSMHGRIDGIWIEREGSLKLVAGLGDPTPGADRTFNSFPGFRESTPVINSAGRTGFLAASGFRTDGFWTYENGVLSPLATVSREPTGTDGTFNRVGDFISAINDSGQALFGADAANTGLFWLNISRVHSLWSGDSDSLAPVVLIESPAPGTETVFSHIFTATLNNSGQSAFYAEVGRWSNSAAAGIWSNTSGTLALVARAGDAAPGTEATFGRMLLEYSRRGPPVINGAGQTAFIAELANSTGYGNEGVGIWSESGGSLTLVARDGSVAPGTDAEFLNFDNLILNGAGQAAFHATLAGSGVGASNQEGIWAQDISGLLKLIVREGDLLDVDDGPGTDFRTIEHLASFIGGTGNEDGRPSGFYELG